LSNNSYFCSIRVCITLIDSYSTFNFAEDFRERRRQKARERAMKGKTGQKKTRDPNRPPRVSPAVTQGQTQQQQMPPFAGMPPGFPPMPPGMQQQWGGSFPPPPPGFQMTPAPGYGQGAPQQPGQFQQGLPQQQQMPQQAQSNADDAKGPPTFVVFDDPQYSQEEVRSKLDRYNLSSEKLQQQYQRVGQSIDSRLSAIGGFFGGGR
jgi:hypothetical protein